MTWHMTRFLVLVWALCWPLGGSAELAVPPLRARVTDQTATLGSEQKAALEQTLQAFEELKGSQIAVLIVPSTEPETIEQYALRAAEQWKLGRPGVDDGALLVVAKNDRALRIEWGMGWRAPSMTPPANGSSAKSSCNGSGRGISTAASRRASSA